MSKIYEPKGKAREYSPLALNYYKGCSHECLYCYVPNMFNRFDNNYNHNSVGIRKSKKDILNDVEKSAKKHRNSKKQVLLNFTSDPYNELEEELHITRSVLEILLEYNIPVSILSKGGNRLLNDLDLFKLFGENIIVGTTLTFFDEKLSLKWEKGAAIPSERLNVLRKLKNEGIRTWSSFEPVIIPDESLKLLKYILDENLCNYVKIGKLNNFKGMDKNIDWYDFINRSVSLLRNYKTDFYIKKDLQKFKKDIYLKDDEINEDFLNIKNNFELSLF